MMMHTLLVAAFLVITGLVGFTDNNALAAASEQDSVVHSATRPTSQPADTDVDILYSFQWRLTLLNGIPLARDVIAPFITFDGKTDRASGFSGVNRFFGGYKMKGNTLIFGPIAGTRMAGTPEAMKLEDQFNKALESTTHWRINGTQLEFLADTTVVAGFQKSAPAPE